MEARFGKLRISPAIRYTRWGNDTPGAPSTFLNEVEALVGFAFQPDFRKLERVGHSRKGSAGLFNNGFAFLGTS